MEQLISKLDPRHPEHAAFAAEIRRLGSEKDINSIAQVINGLIQAQVVLDDPLPDLVKEFTWTDPTGKEQAFYAPVKIHNNEATVMLPGKTLGVAKISQNKIWIAKEEVTTPEYPVDTRDLEAGDLVTIEMIKNFGMNALIVQKVLRFYELMCSGDDMTNPAATNSKVIVIEDDGSFTTGDPLMPTYVPILQRKLKDVVSKFQEQLNVSSVQGGDVRGFCRQITLDVISRAEVSGITIKAIPAAEDENERPYFTEGELVVFSTYACNIAKIEDVEGSNIQKEHYVTSFAYRWSHKYIRWDTKYIRRILIMPKGTATAWGTVKVLAFDTNGMTLDFSRPVLKSSISATNLKLEESTNSGSTYSEVSAPIGSVEVGYDMRKVRITWASGAVDAGKQYRVSNQSATYFCDAYSTADYHKFTQMVASENVFKV